MKGWLRNSGSAEVSHLFDYSLVSENKGRAKKNKMVNSDCLSLFLTQNIWFSHSLFWILILTSENSKVVIKNRIIMKHSFLSPTKLLYQDRKNRNQVVWVQIHVICLSQKVKKEKWFFFKAPQTRINSWDQIWSSDLCNNHNGILFAQTKGDWQQFNRVDVLFQNSTTSKIF